MSFALSSPPNNYIKAATHSYAFLARDKERENSFIVSKENKIIPQKCNAYRTHARVMKEQDCEIGHSSSQRVQVRYFCVSPGLFVCAITNF